ncbi:MAG TPA: alpha-amylase family glycosyl hydrolase [Bacilli bacterium]|nr:alpha-amylase family glycosyl hydrolase [Bacilli bacterium]
MSDNIRWKTIFVALIGVMTLAACGKSSSISSSGSTSSSTTSTSLVSVSEGSSVDNEDYEASMSWSQPNHLYIHYKRIVDTMDEYSAWTIWAWQKAPYDLGGLQIEWTLKDQSGVIAALDFSGATVENEGHLYQSGQAMNQITRLGFLIVLRSSMQPGSPGMWTSDGGTDIYINDFNTHIRPDGSIHIFAVQGAVSDFEFSYTGTEASDPYANDTGQLESISNVNSSQSSFARAKTSPDFYGQVGSGYQIFVRSFADSDGDGEGDIRGITQKLDYIEALGVKALWLTPVHKSETYHGYDVTDFYMIDPSIGTLTDYAELIYEAHARDIRVVMDLVVNHTSTQNVWFQKSINLKTGTDSAGNEIDYRHFYHWRYDPTHALQAPWHRFGTTNYYYYGKFATGMPELNYDYQGTRDAMVDVAKYWAAFGVDGFRIDAVKHIYMADEATGSQGDIIVEDYDANTDTDYSSNRTKNVNFFKEFNFRIKSVYPDMFLVGENFDGWDARMAPYYEGMDSQFDFHNYYHLVNMMHGIESGSPQAEAAVYATKYNTHFKTYRNQPINSPFTSNHDLPRVLNHVMGDKINASEVKAAQTVSAITYQTALNKALAFNATTLLLPGTSWIYYGDELGMTGNWVLNDDTTSYPGTDYHVDRWYRQPMKWANTPTSFDTGYMFEGYTVMHDGVNSTNTVQGATEQMANADSMFSRLKAINDYKHQNTTLINGTYGAISTGRSDIFSFQVQGDGGTYYIYVNFGSTTQNGYRNGGSTLGLSINGATTDSLPGYSAVVLR